MSLLLDLPLDLPLIQAPMAGVQDATLALAVGEAGGLGSLPAAQLTADALVAELQRLQATGRPYNLNFFCHVPPTPDAARQAAWVEALRPYYEELGLDPARAESGPGRQPFDAAVLARIAPFKPPVLSFHFGLPDEALLAPIRAWGGRILSSATTVAEARWLAARGVDAVIAQGLEAGGHRGMFLTEDLSTQLGSFALLPQVVKAVDVPVIAAGGIADAAGVAAARALGARAVQVGSAYLLCPEVTISPLHRAALRDPQRGPTQLTRLFTGRPARGLVNRLMRELGPLSPLAPAFPLATGALAPLRTAAEARGRSDFSPLWAGQNLDGCRAVPAAALSRELAAGWTRP